MKRTKQRTASKVKRCHPDPLNARQIGQRIKSARKRREWTQRDLAQATGLSVSGIVGWETGARIPQTDALARLTVALRRKCDWILFGRRSLWNRRASRNEK